MTSRKYGTTFFIQSKHETHYEKLKGKRLLFLYLNKISWDFSFQLIEAILSKLCTLKILRMTHMKRVYNWLSMRPSITITSFHIVRLGHNAKPLFLTTFLYLLGGKRVFCKEPLARSRNLRCKDNNNKEHCANCIIMTSSYKQYRSKQNDTEQLDTGYRLSSC